MSWSPEAELHFTRGMLHYKRGEAILPQAMALREDKVPPGVDVALALMSLATVATSKALGQTRWIEEYRGHMRAAVDSFDRALALEPDYPEAHYRRALSLRYLGETDAARSAARAAAQREPGNPDYASLLKVLEGPSQAPRPAPAVRGTTGRTPPRPMTAMPTDSPQKLSWDDIILPPRTKRELRQVQLVLENPSQARRLGVEPPSGLLLYGPPGTGKTTIARILAAQAKCRFFSASPAEVFSMWIGEGEKAVARLFENARTTAPSIVFLDEIDALIPNRQGGISQPSDKIVNQFLHEIDGLEGSRGVFVVGATNRPELLDAALLRGGRLSLKIEIPLPDEAARQAILQLHTKGVQLIPGVDLDEVARDAEGFSGADLRALVNEAGLQALIRIADDGGVQAVTVADFVSALESIQPGEAQ